VAAVVMIGLFQWTDFRELSIESAGHVGTAVVLFVLWRLGTRPPHGLYSASTVFAGVYAAFHFGLTSSLAIGVEPTEYLNAATFLWIEDDVAVEAVRWSSVGMLALLCGVTLAELAGPGRKIELPWDARVEDGLGRVGSLLVGVSVLSWFLILVSSGGAAIFLGSYMSMKAATSGASIPYVLLGINLGVPLLAATRFREFHWFGVAGCVLFAVLGFPLGLRGEVLFPAGAVVVILARRGVIRPRPRLLAVAVVLILGASSFVRDMRTSGLAGLQTAEVSSNPFHGLMELGSSLRPVVAVITWAEAGEEYAMGATYWAPFERAITRFVPIAPRPPAEEDERLMNTLVKQRRLGPIGFSPVAESYRNFGPWGVVGVMMVLGFILGRIGQWPRTGMWPAATGLVLIPLLNHVRNAFVPVPAQLVAGAVLVMGVVMVVRLRLPRRYRRPDRRAPPPREPSSVRRRP
jgi:hypothetical protein